MRLKGYDLVVLNFPEYPIPGTTGLPNRDGGTDYIERNAMVLIKLIQYVNDQLAINGSSEKLVIIGPSMGGQVSRYALKYMENHNMNHNTRLWVAFDSPNLGANIPLGLQALLWYSGYQLNQVEALDNYNYKIRAVASRQLLLHQAVDVAVRVSYVGGPTYPTHSIYSITAHPDIDFNEPFRTTWQSSIDNLGYPNNLRKIALINGTVTGGSYSSNCGNILDWYAVKNGWPQRHVTLTEMRPYYLPGNNTSCSVFDGYIKDQGSYSVWFGNSGIHGNIDGAPGGTYLTNLKVKMGLPVHGISTPGTFILGMFHASVDADCRLVNYQRDDHCFIPSVSSLGFYNSDFDWSANIDRDLVCNNEIPFDNYFAAQTNELHTFISNDAAAWITKEIDNGGTTSGCARICPDNWPSAICDGSTIRLSLTNVPATTGGTSGYNISWSAPASYPWTPSNLSVSNLAANHSAADITANWSNTNNPNKTITVAVQSPCGADYTIRRSFTIVKISGLTPTINVTSTATAGRWSATTAFPAPSAGVSTNWSVTYLRGSNYPITSATGMNLGSTPPKILNTGDTIAWTISATTINNCGTLDDHSAYVITSTGGLSWIDYNPPRMIRTPAENELSIAPNPAHNSWLLSFTNVSHKPVSIALADVAGRVIRNISVDDPDATEISCAELPKGLYVATIHYDDGTKTSRKLQKE